MLMISKEFPDVPLKAPMCLASIDNTKHVCCKFALSPHLASRPLSPATPQPAMLVPSLPYPSLPLLACDAHAPTPLLVTRRSKPYHVSKQA